MSEQNLSAIKQHMTNLVKQSTKRNADTTTTDYIYQFNETDRKYDTSQYATSGTFSKTTTPWLNTFESIPCSWRLTKSDQEKIDERTEQVDSANGYIQAQVPKQSYSGAAIEQLQQRFTKGMLDPSIFSQTQINTLTENWINDDYEFARQRLGSANPDVIAKYKGTNESLETLISNSAGFSAGSNILKTLTEANSKGQLFVCDYNPALANIEKNGYVQTNAKPDYMPNGFYFSVPIAFFVIETINDKDVLKPVAIQIESTKNGYIFTTDDGPNAWLLAKLWVASADAQWWFSGTHLYNTHSIDMIFGIAALNQQEQGKLPEDHPMLVLMRPHLNKVFEINDAVYNASSTESLYQKGQFTDQFLPTGRVGIYQLINDLYQNYSFDDQAFDKTMAARSMTIDDFTGSFPYRDDGQVWWDAIGNFVSSIVDDTYSNDGEVAADEGLNGWMNTVQSAFNQDGTTRFTWTPTLAYLKQAFTNLFYLTTAQHTAVNDTMLPGWAFVPNGAFAMTAKPPTKGSVSDSDLLASLPDPQAKSKVDVDGTMTDLVAWPISNQISFVISGTSDVTDLAAGDGTAKSLHNMYPYEQGSAQYNSVTDFYNALWVVNDSVKKQIINNQNNRIDQYQTVNPDATTVPNSVSYYYLSVTLPDGLDLNAPVMNCIMI